MPRPPPAARRPRRCHPRGGCDSLGRAGRDPFSAGSCDSYLIDGTRLTRAVAARRTSTVDPRVKGERPAGGRRASSRALRTSAWSYARTSRKPEATRRLRYAADRLDRVRRERDGRTRGAISPCLGPSCDGATAAPCPGRNAGGRPKSRRMVRPARTMAKPKQIRALRLKGGGKPVETYT